MLSKEIIYFGEEAIISCDGKCNKAWGIHSRPRIDFSEEDYDDYAFLSDEELGEAPINPGTYEGRDGKPEIEEDKLNKWCARECERCSIHRRDEEVTLKDYSKRRYNNPFLHK